MQKYDEFEHILVCSSTYNVNKFKALVKDAVVVENMKNAISPKSDLSAILSVRKLIKKYNPDIIYCHSSKAGAIGRIADIGFNNKVIYNAHGWSFNMKGQNSKIIKLYKFIEKTLAKYTDKIVCISEYEKERALNNNICSIEKIIVINNGIDFEEYLKVQPKCRDGISISQDAFVIGAVGRLHNTKAPDIFVRMASIVKETIPQAFFIMVGDGPYREIIEKQIEDANLKDSFYITGWVDDPLDYINLFDVATLLSRWEGFGLVLPEYMLMGKPIVATKAGAIPYVIGDAGLLIDVDDFNQASDSVIKLFQDKELKASIVKKGNARVNLFNANRTAYEHFQLFEQLVTEE